MDVTVVMIGIHNHFASQPSAFIPPPPVRPTPADEPSRSTTDSSANAPASASTPAESVNRHGVGNARAAEKNQAGSEHKSRGNEPQANTTDKPKSPLTLSEEELLQVEKLRDRDREVRAHEAAHLAAAGRYARGGAKFTTVRGPDGRAYAIGGSVGIDTGRESTPEATIQKAEQVRRAALAPAEPSGKDRAVAAQAAKLKLDAQAELAQESRASSATNSQQETTEEHPVVPQADADKDDLAPGVNRLNAKDAATLLCEICGGDHGTGSHLDANKAKLGVYTTNSQPAPPQTLISRMA